MDWSSGWKLEINGGDEVGVPRWRPEIFRSLGTQKQKQSNKTTSPVNTEKNPTSFLNLEMKWKWSLLHLLKVMSLTVFQYLTSFLSYLNLFDNLWRKVMYRSFKVTRKSCASLRLMNNTWSCDVQRVHTHLICKVLSDVTHGFLSNFIWSVHNFTSHVVSFTFQTNLNNSRTK